MTGLLSSRPRLPTLSLCAPFKHRPSPHRALPLRPSKPVTQGASFASVLAPKKVSHSATTRKLYADLYCRDIACRIAAGQPEGLHTSLLRLERLNFSEKLLRLNQGNGYGFTWLMQAAATGYLGVTTCLLKHGADAHTTDKAKLNAANWAQMYGHLHLVELLATYGVRPKRVPAQLDLSLRAILVGHAELLRLCMRCPCPNLYGAAPAFPPQHPAGLCTHPLYDARHHLTPLTAAAHLYPRASALQAILEQGADVEQTCREGTSALQLVACSRGDAHAALEVLLSHGANPNRATAWGWSPLHLVAAYSAAPHQGLAVLLAHHADIHATCGPTGWTPLHLLVAQGDHPEAVQLLLEHGAHPLRLSAGEAGTGVSALDLALLYGRSASFHRLLAG